MRYIFRQTLLTLVSFAFLYAVMGVVSLLVFPEPSGVGPRDFQAAGRTIFMTVPKYIFLGRSVLDSSEDKVLLVGASNTAVGFVQKAIQSQLACASVSNLAMGGANISEVKQVIDLVHDTQTPEHRLHNTFVIGVWYGMFADSEIRYADPDRNRGETDLDIEKYRYGLYRRTVDGPAAVLPVKWLDAAVMALRPLLLVEKAAREARAGVNLILTGRKSAQRTEAEREAALMSDQDKKKALQYWIESMGSQNNISEGQLTLLKETIETVLNSDERIVLVDLPIPAWHRDASPFQADYEHRLRELIGQFKDNANFASMSMGDLDGDLDYSDEVHAKRHLADVWSDRLTNVLNSFVCQNKAERPRLSLRDSGRAVSAP